jgi:putative isomerase
MVDKTPIEMLKNRIDLKQVPFTDRGSRLLVLERDGGLVVRLSERWAKIDPHVVAYRQRPPLLDQFFFTDPNHELLDFELESYPHCLNFQTRLGTFWMVFVDQDTLLISIPESECGLSFRVKVDEGVTDRRGGLLRVKGAITRTIAYTTNRRMKSNTILPLEDGYVQVNIDLDSGSPCGFMINITPRLGFNRHIPGLEVALNKAARRWEEWFQSAPNVREEFQEQYYYAWYVMRAGLISSRYYTTREAMTPSKILYVGLWAWDAYFHAIAYRHIDMTLAKDQIRVVLDHQRPDGMLPDAVHDEGVITELNFPITADVTKPPLLSWAAWKLYEIDHDREFLEEIYEGVVRWNDWWFKVNDIDGDGLCEYQHPYSSGLDDSPLWDEGMPVTSPDLNTYLYLQMENLARMARVLDLNQDAEYWDQRKDDLLERMLRYLWDEPTGLFLVQLQGRPVQVLTPFSLFPLLTGKLPENIARRLVEHLKDPETFWARYPVPTVAHNDLKFTNTVMWRGPVWINVNYLLVEGLERSGFSQEAQQLRQRTLEMVSLSKDIFEYYDPETGEPSPTAAGTFGWSAALFIDLALQNSQLRSAARIQQPGGSDT